MPRPSFTPWDPITLQEWDGSTQRQRREKIERDDYVGGPGYAAGPLRQQQPMPVLANGSLTPTSFIEALMQSTPGVDPLGSTEELVELAHAIEFEMETLLTPREKFVVEAIVFEGLSLRQVAARWHDAWSKTQVARIRDTAYRKLAQSETLRRLAGLPEEE